MDKAIWLIPLLPFAGFLINTFLGAFAGKRVPKVVYSFVALSSVAGAAIVAWLAFFHVRSGHEPLVSAGLTWFEIPGLGDGWLLIDEAHPQADCHEIWVEAEQGWLTIVGGP